MTIWVAMENLNRGNLFWAIMFREGDYYPESVWQTTEKHKCRRLLVESEGAYRTAYLMADDSYQATMLARIRLGIQHPDAEEE